jgi:membrane protease YdiL (CAAX protease family)
MQPAPEREPFWDYHDLALAACLAIPASVTGSLVKIGLTRLLPNAGPALPTLTGQFLGLYALWFFALYWLLRTRYQRPFWSSLGWRIPPRGLASSFLLGPAVAFVCVMIGALLRTPEVDMPMNRLMEDRVSIMLVGFSAVFLAPVCEELAFRGFLYPLLAKTFGAAGGILLSALPFALLHGPQYAWSWRHVLMITLASVAFGWSRYRTRSTAAAAAMHATYNLTLFTGNLFTRMGT